MPPTKGFDGQPEKTQDLDPTPEKDLRDLDGPQPGSNQDNDYRDVGFGGGISLGGGFGSNQRDGGQKRSAGSSVSRRGRFFQSGRR